MPPVRINAFTDCSSGCDLNLKKKKQNKRKLVCSRTEIKYTKRSQQADWENCLSNNTARCYNKSKSKVKKLQNVFECI